MAAPRMARQPAVDFSSHLCASWSAEHGASGPLPHTRYMLIEAQQRMNGGSCSNGHLSPRAAESLSRA